MRFGLFLLAAGCEATPSASGATAEVASPARSSGGVGAIAPGGATSGATSSAPDAGLPPSNGTATAPRAGAGAIDVTGRPSNDSTIDVTGNSDLPPNIPSTAQPYVRVIEVAVRPVRAAVVECVRSLGVGRRVVHTTVRSDGHMALRPPQDFTMTREMGDCLRGVIEGTVVNPPPPLEVPYDLRVEVGAP